MSRREQSSTLTTFSSDKPESPNNERTRQALKHQSSITRSALLSGTGVVWCTNGQSSSGDLLLERSCIHCCTEDPAELMHLVLVVICPCKDSLHGSSNVKDECQPLHVQACTVDVLHVYRFGQQSLTLCHVSSIVLLPRTYASLQESDAR